MRKHVKPAHPEATIFDPYRGRDLTPEGHPVEWTPYWVGLEARGDILAEDVTDELSPAPDGADPATPEIPSTSPETHASDPEPRGRRKSPEPDTAV